MNLFARVLVTCLVLSTSGECVVAQKLTEVLNETIIVNSKTAIGGHSRLVTSVRFPRNTYSYIYRITAAKKGDLTVPNTLFSLLKNLQDQKVALAASLAELVINNGQNNSIDAFIFTTSSDAESFVNSKDDNWDACQGMINVGNSCRLVNNCIGENIRLGFRNNNFVQGIEMKIEIVALSNTKKNNQYRSTFNILNRTDADLVYDLSFDNKKWWTAAPLQKSHKDFCTLDVDRLFMRVYTTDTLYRTIALYPNMRYMINWDDKKKWLDILTY